MNPLFHQWREAAEKATLAEQLVFNKTTGAQLPADLPSDAELANAVLLRLKAADLLQRLLSQTRAQYEAARHPHLPAGGGGDR